MRIPLAISLDGKYLAFTVDNPQASESWTGGKDHFTQKGISRADGGPGLDIQMVDISSGLSSKLSAGGTSNWSPAWSPGGDRLAFYSDRSGRAGLCIWSRKTETFQDITEPATRPFYGHEVPQWTPDGRYLVVKAVPEGCDLSDLRQLQVTCDATQRSASPTFKQYTSPDSLPLPGAESLRAALVLIDTLGEHEPQTLAENAKVTWYRVTGCGRYVVYAKQCDKQMKGSDPAHDLEIVSLVEGARLTLSSNIGQQTGTDFACSPDGQWVAYIDERRCFAVNWDNGRKQIKALRHDAANSSPVFTAPVWRSDSEQFFACAPGAVLRFDLGQNTETLIPLPKQWAIKYIVCDSNGNLWQPFSRDDVVIAYEEQATGSQGFALLSHREFQPLFSMDETIPSLSHYAVGSLAEESMIYVSNRHDHDSRVWHLSLSADSTPASRKCLSSINPGLDSVKWASVSTITWQDAKSGEARSGSLMLPPGHEPGDRHPLILWVYGNYPGSKAKNTFGFTASPFNMQFFASHGYAVLYPDAPMGVGSPLEDLAAAVLPGIDAVIERGYADEGRLAVMGQSYGAYCVFGLITMTNRFQAAVASAGFGNLFSVYTDFWADGAAPAVEALESGWGLMGANPWEERDRYITNSPFFYLDKVETPVLLTTGEHDFCRRWTEEMFVGLRRLGKEAELVCYEGEGHAPQRPANATDFYQRRLTWLQKYVPGKATNGI
ncbi:MAG: prolyl oligopeptidase family serine peptidase [Gammaproteobacteria bacterium]|nr:prolyl oligopeptidase family serine peptidase [Gammaproteobacteria bacterium]